MKIEKNIADLREAVKAKLAEADALQAELMRAEKQNIIEELTDAIVNDESACDALEDMTAAEAKAIKRTISKRFVEAVNAELAEVRSRADKHKAARQKRNETREREQSFTAPSAGQTGALSGYDT